MVVSVCQRDKFWFYWVLWSLWHTTLWRWTFYPGKFWAGLTSLSAQGAQKRIADAAAQNIILQFHSRQDCDISVCDSDNTWPKKSLLDPAKSLPGLSTGRSVSLWAFSLLWRQVSFGAGVETSFIWSKCASVSSCWCSWRQNTRQQAEGLDAEPECPLKCGGKATKSTPRAICTDSFPRLGGV